MHSLAGRDKIWFCDFGALEDKKCIFQTNYRIETNFCFKDAKDQNNREKIQFVVSFFQNNQFLGKKKDDC